MKKNFLKYFIVALLFTSCEKEISDIQKDYFIKMYGTYLKDGAVSIVPSTAGNYLICGTSETAGGGNDIVLFTVDESGNQTSGFYYSGLNGNDRAYSLKKISNGFIVSGSMINNQGNMDALVFTVDNKGEINTEPQLFGGSGNDYAFDIEKKHDEGYIFVGSTQQQGLDLLYIVSLDDDLSGPDVSRNVSGIQARLTRIEQTNDNEYLAAGTNVLDPVNGYSRFMLTKINRDGNFYIVRYFGSQDQQLVLNDMLQLDESVIYMLGTLIDSQSGQSSIVLKKIVDFRETDSYTYSAEGSLEGRALTMKDDGSLIVAADQTLADDTNIMLLLLDQDGQEIGERKQYGGTGNQTASAVIYDNERILILGTNAYRGNSMISLIKTDENGNIWNE